MKKINIRDTKPANLLVRVVKDMRTLVISHSGQLTSLVDRGEKRELGTSNKSR